jgi:hypothetical protein
MYYMFTSNTCKRHRDSRVGKCYQNLGLYQSNRRAAGMYKSDDWQSGIGLLAEIGQRLEAQVRFARCMYWKMRLHTCRRCSIGANIPIGNAAVASKLYFLLSEGVVLPHTRGTGQASTRHDSEQADFVELDLQSSICRFRVSRR